MIFPNDAFYRQIRFSGKMRILLILSVLLAGTGTLFLYWYDQAQQACDQISDQCGCGVCLGSQRKTAPDCSLSDTVDLSHPLFLPRLEERINQENPRKTETFLKLKFGGVSLHRRKGLHSLLWRPSAGIRPLRIKILAGIGVGSKFPCRSSPQANAALSQLPTICSVSGGMKCIETPIRRSPELFGPEAWVVVDGNLSRFQGHQYGFCFFDPPGDFLPPGQHVVFMVSIIMGQDLSAVGSRHHPHATAFH